MPDRPAPETRTHEHPGSIDQPKVPAATGVEELHLPPVKRDERLSELPEAELDRPAPVPARGPALGAGE